MRSYILSGVIGGLIAGVVFGMGMQMMTAPTPDMGRIPMIKMVAMVVRSDSIVIGWLYHMFNSAVIGGIFGLLFGSFVARGYPIALGLGAVYGVVWWVLGALIIMPVLLGMAAFAPLTMPEMRSVAMGSLMGHIIYGLILGGAMVALLRTRTFATGRTARTV